MVSLSGVKEIIADTISLQEGNQIVNIKDKFYDKSTLNTMLSSIIGVPSNTLNSLEKVSTALNGDPNFFTTISGKLDDKQAKISNGTSITGSQNLLDTTTSKLKNIVCSNLTIASVKTLFMASSLSLPTRPFSALPAFLIISLYFLYYYNNLFNS